MFVKNHRSIIWVLSFIVLLFGTACGGAKKRRTPSRVHVTKPAPAHKKVIEKREVVSTSRTSKPASPRKESKIITAIINHAKGFEGTRYVYGGTTKKGMDCSGLVYTAFKKEAIELPRSSRYMAVKGVEVSLKKVRRGDLLFFKTSKKKKSINHVGIVVSAKKGEVKFIHTSVSKGVVVSSLNERYWNGCYALAKRIVK